MLNLFRKKSVESVIEKNHEHGLERTMGALDVTIMSIGAVIGTGVMVLTGVAANTKAGPAVVLSFIMSAIVCSLVGLCYAEFASSIPTSGSAYSYLYVSIGEFVAHIMGWSLIMGYALSTALVAVGWSDYFKSFLGEFGVQLPALLTKMPSDGGIINLPAVLVVLLVTFLLSRGMSESKKVNNIMVVVKLAVILLFLGVGIFHVNTANWTPFMPFGAQGVFSGAAFVFFAYTGFDAVSTSAEEVKNPQRNLPIGIVASLAVCTLIYVAVCLVLTGIVPYTELKGGDAMAFALAQAGQGWAASLLAVGAVIGILAVMFAYSFGASRILFSMSRDGLLPKAFSKVNKKTNVPVLSTWIIGAVASLMSGMVPIKQLADIVNLILIGTFMLVALSVITLRKSHPNLERGFTVPFGNVLPAIAVASCAFLLVNIPPVTWVYFGIWAAVGAAIYFGYSKKNSSLNGVDVSTDTAVLQDISVKKSS